jgi:hypothetical protein
MPAPLIKRGETPGRIDRIYVADAGVVESVIIGAAGNAAVALSVTPWPSDRRAVGRRRHLTPVDAPALITVEPRPVVAGQSLLIRVNTPARANRSALVTPRDSGVETALTGIVDIDPADRLTIRLSSIGMAAGTYDAVLLTPEGAELVFHYRRGG